MLLGSFLGTLEALLGALLGLCPTKTLKKLKKFFKVLEDVAFRFFEALESPLGLILLPSWADLAPK